MGGKGKREKEKKKAADAANVSRAPASAAAKGGRTPGRCLGCTDGELCWTHLKGPLLNAAHASATAPPAVIAAAASAAPRQLLGRLSLRHMFQHEIKDELDRCIIERLKELHAAQDYQGIANFKIQATAAAKIKGIKKPWQV